MLEVSYTPTVDDMVSFHMFTVKRSAQVRQRLVFGWVGIPFGLLVMAVALWLAGVYLPVPIGLTVAGVLVALTFPMLNRMSVTRFVRRQVEDLVARGAVGRLTLTLTDGELRVKGQVTDTSAKWDKIRGIVAGEDCTYIFLTESFAVVVPRHALPSDADYAAVRDFAADRVPELV